MAHAQAKPANEQALDAAAAAYDEGVEAFDRAEYKRAVVAFLRADSLIPSDEALSNAITAGVRGGEHLMVTQAAQRAIARQGTDPKLVTRARRALAFAGSKLAQLDLSCEPLPCGIALDGEVVTAGARYVLPGNHELVAIAGDGQRNQKQLDLVAGTRYRVLIRTTDAKAGEQLLELSSQQQGAAVKPVEAGSLDRKNRFDRQPDSVGGGLPPWTFYTGAALSVVLLGVTTWSGLDALAAKNDLGRAPREEDRDAALDKIHRTDILVGATAVSVAATLYLGLFAVDWGDAEVSASLGWVQLRGRF
ncbi:MAG: hypothetical protein H6718_01815 [Polyangiaceae bacterium]|nr:hypothetical protein [Myxococcales bacterium]MCB9584100.1 hypothetical protein [Polyangiaceae bacterium]